LEYGGPGELWGFPWEDDGDGRWYSALTLKDGVTLSDGTNSFKVRGIEKEQTMRDVALSPDCDALNVDTALSMVLPSAVSGTPSFAWGDMPTITDAPAVIEGELQ